MDFTALFKKFRSFLGGEVASDVDQSYTWLMKSLEMLPKPFFLVDYTLKRVAFSNAAARRMLGPQYADRTIEQYYGHDISLYDYNGNLIPIQNLPSARVARREKINGEEFILDTPIGRFEIKVFSGEIPKMFGRPAMGLILFQDISALKSTEKSLLRVQAELNEAVETAMVGFWSVDLRTMKTTISEQVERQFGLAPGEFDGTVETVLAQIHPEDSPRVRDAIQLSMTTGAPYRIEYRVKHRDGTVRWIEAKSGAIGDKIFDSNRFAGTTLDITERVLSRQRLEVSERALRELADSMPQVVWSADPNGNLDYFNQVWFDYCGADFEANKGAGWTQFVHPEDLPQTIARWQQSIKSNAPYENEFRLRHCSGDYRWHVARARPVFKDDGQSEVKKWYGANTDIHDRKLLNESLADARVAAERANSAKSQFLANMSHEIRTPLGAIIGFSELIKDNGLGRKERDEFIGVIERNSAQLLRIIDDILDLSKVEAGMMLIESIAFSLPEALTDFSSLMGFKAREKGIRFTSKAVTSLPRSIISDPTRLRQILMNVVGNAIKFTDKGTVELRVKFENEVLEFEVEDTGRGISAEQAKILFQPFTQADASTTRKFGGTGLGLALTRSLAEAMGGSFELKQSELGRGSTFLVRVAAKVAPGTEMYSGYGFEPPSAKSVTNSGQLAGSKILVVEDSPDNQALISIYLNRAGASIDIAEDGEQGHKMALASDYDVVLMDVQMPVMDGIAAVKLLRLANYKKPIIALTAHAMKEERQRCLEAGFTDFLTKPVTREELIDMIQRFRA